MNNVKRIVIAGGGTAGWMAANYFAHKWPKDKVEVTLVESPDIGIIGVGEGSTPTLKRFFNEIGLRESDWMPKCNATYKVSIQFNDWSPASGIKSYRHPFISQTDTFTQRAFEVNCRTRRLGLDTHVLGEDFLINGALAKLNKAPVTPENFPFRMEYGYHFDSALLGGYLRDVAVSRGVEHISANISNVALHPNGDIHYLVTDSVDKIEADFFIDCTGFSSKLLQDALGIQFNSYSDNLFNDAAVVLPTSVQDVISVETQSTALSNGWCWTIPLQSRTGNGYVFSSSHLSPDAAETELRAFLGLSDDVEARHLKMKVGQVEKHWHRNCLALGLSQGFIEPLEATALHLVQICIEQFSNLYEKGSFSNKEQNNYNAFAKERFDRVRDYIVAHYKLNTRDDSQYWRDNRNNTKLSSSLMGVLNSWFSREDVAQEIAKQDIGMHWDSVSWHCLLAGYGAFPALAANQPGQGDLYKEQNVSQFIDGCALNFPAHQAVLKQYQ